jgi:hypothetical protein
MKSKELKPTSGFAIVFDVGACHLSKSQIPKSKSSPRRRLDEPEAKETPKLKRTELI